MSRSFIVIALVATVMVVSITVLLEILTMVAGWGILFGRVEQLVLAIAAFALAAALGIVCWMIIWVYTRRTAGGHPLDVTLESG